jgi:16S rRNA G966 N2-methylase RsmD
MREILNRLDDDKLKNRFLKRIESYKKKYGRDEEKVRNYLLKIENEIRYAIKEKELIARIIDTYGNDEKIQQLLIREIKNGKYVTFSLRGDEEPFNLLIRHFQDYPQAALLINKDFRDGPVAPDSVDVIVTDPPYPKKFLPLYKDLAVFAARVLKPGGSLFAMAGQSYLPDIFKLMETEGLHYNWMLSYLTPGGQSPQIWPRKVNAFWKPVLWFVKGKPGFWLGDVVKSNVNDNDKNFHHWGQSLSGMADLINKVSFVGQTVLDPFMGGGTTGIVAAKLNRKFIGYEIDKNSFEVAVQRFRDNDIPVQKEF